MDHADQARGTYTDDDITDPYGAPAHVFAGVARTITRLLEIVVPAVAGSPTRSASTGMGILAP